MFVRRLLPDRHFSPESKDVVRIAMGLVATTLALVLGLLVASAKTFYDTQTTEITQVSANVLLLDRLLAHYGPETAEARAALRNTVAHEIEFMWPRAGSNEGGPQLTAHAEVLIDKIQALSPKDDSQRSFQTQALNLAIQLGQIRMLFYEQRQVPVPSLLLVMLTFWLIALFVSFGLFAPRTLTVLVSLFVAAAAVCGAIFLILEMYYPYTGWIQLSDAPLRAALARLGR
jgi:hypothetical protein